MTRAPALRDLDVLALNYLDQGGPFQTYQVARACGLDREAGDAATTRTRNLLKRLERHHLVARDPRLSGASTIWWRITGSGRTAIGSAA